MHGNNVEGEVVVVEVVEEEDGEASLKEEFVPILLLISTFNVSFVVLILHVVVGAGAGMMAALVLSDAQNSQALLKLQDKFANHIVGNSDTPIF